MPQPLDLVIQQTLGKKYDPKKSYRLVRPKEKIKFEQKGWKEAGFLDSVNDDNDMVIMEATK